VAETRPQRLFYSIFLTIGVVVNLGLGWLLVGSGAFCCAIAGWLAAAAWSRSYWSRTMARHVAVWRSIAGTFFSWLEEVPVTTESLQKLKSSLDEVVPASKQR
jgi:hypothetical protein